MLERGRGIAVDDVVPEGAEYDVEGQLGQAALRSGAEDRVRLVKGTR